MAIIKKNEKDEYIVVHHVYGETDVLDFLRMTSHLILDKLCFEAKTAGQTTFRFRGQMYKMSWDRGMMFVVEPMEDEIAEID